MHYAVGELGSTGARFELVARRETGWVRLLRDSERLPLGPNVFSGGKILGEDRDRLAAVLHRWRALCEQTGAQTRFVATSAFRDARNAAEVAEGLLTETGLRVEPLSGTQEAELIARGALSTAVNAPSVVVIDVGGGSTEIAVGAHGECQETLSLPLGSARIEPVARSLAQAADAIDALLKRTLPREFARGAAMALITSGTSRAVLKWSAPASAGCLSVSQLEERLPFLARLSHAERVEHFGHRETKVLPATLILSRVMARLRTPVLVPCKQGLRHGMLLELIEGSLAPKARAS